MNEGNGAGDFLVAACRIGSYWLSVFGLAAAIAMCMGATWVGGAPGHELSGAIKVEGGRTHTCVIVPGGTVQCWGRNAEGQLGDQAPTIRRMTPVAVKGLSGVTALALGEFHTCALVSGGTVHCWGKNQFGQLGDGTTTDSLEPVQVEQINAAIAITVGSLHTCALVSGGSVYCWGHNLRGQLAAGSDVQFRATPAPVPGISDATDVVGADGFHNCAIVSGGAVRCWGWNSGGQLGRGTVTDHEQTAEPVVDLSGAIALAGGSSNTCALVSGGDVYCWGQDNFGQLGDGGPEPSGQISDSTSLSAKPVKVVGLSGVTAISEANGGGHFCAIVSGGRVDCWGHNGFGQQGDGRVVHNATPVAVAGLSNVIGITGGGDHFCALVSRGAVRCWGWNEYGQLGDGTTANRSTPVAVVLEDSIHSSVPTAVRGLSDPTAITNAAGSAHTCAIAAGGVVRCWGDNKYGQLGDGTTTDRRTPSVVAGLSGVTALAAGWDHTCAIVSGGTVRCWGYNGFGQLGDGSLVQRSKPVTVAGLTNAIAITAGRHHTCAIVSGGAARCWGYNYLGQLGDGSFPEGPYVGNPIFRATPVPVAQLTGATAIAAGGDHTCVIVSDATLRCWGYNWFGNLGVPSVQGKISFPVAVDGVSQVTAITANGDHTCAIAAGGAVHCWGANAFGQLGNGTRIDGKIPMALDGFSATTIAAGGDHTCATVASGAVYCWGRNEFGELGDGATTDQLTPTAVGGISSATAIAAGAEHTCAIDSRGIVRCWGHNHQGQLGTQRESAR